MNTIALVFHIWFMLHIYRLAVMNRQLLPSHWPISTRAYR